MPEYFWFDWHRDSIGAIFGIRDVYFHMYHKLSSHGYKHNVSELYLPSIWKLEWCIYSHVPVRCVGLKELCMPLLLPFRPSQLYLQISPTSWTSPEKNHVSNAFWIAFSYLSQWFLSVFEKRFQNGPYSGLSTVHETNSFIVRTQPLKLI